MTFQMLFSPDQHDREGWILAAICPYMSQENISHLDFLAAMSDTVNTQALSWNIFVIRQFEKVT